MALPPSGWVTGNGNNRGALPAAVEQPVKMSSAHDFVETPQKHRN